MSEREAHPAAGLFPMMEDEDLNALANDIKANGLIEPILLYEDKILDGRNRLKACERAGVAPQFADAALNGSSPVAFVISKNLHRRHMTKSQLSTVAADMIPLLAAEAEERKRLGQVNGGLALHGMQLQSDFGLKLNQNARSSNSQAAKLVGIAHTIVGQAVAVKAKDPEAFERIRRGEIATNVAYEQVRAGAPALRRKQYALPKEGTRKREQYEGAARRRMVDGLSAMRGYARGLGGLDATLLAKLERKERNQWLNIIREITLALRGFARNLKGEKK